MAMVQSPTSARARYNASFNSQIFDPAPQRGEGYVPAGKRRDQSTAEMFGSYQEKDLRSCPKTFIPKDDYHNARQKKQHFLSSDVLPRSAYPAGDGNGMPYNSSHPGMMAPDTDEVIDPNLRRQEELSSKLFDRETPACTYDQVHDTNARLTPNDFKWHNHPEPQRGQQMNHTARAYQEKCSSVLDHRSPNMDDYQRTHGAADRAAKEENSIADSKRRANAHYSDLFGRETPMEAPSNTGEDVFRAKPLGSHEDEIIVHRDWTDSKTELMRGSQGSRPEHPLLRKSEELHQTRIWGSEAGWQSSVDRPQAVTHDNSSKTRRNFGEHTQNIHQAHLRSSIRPDEFYEEAHNTKHWEVAELHVSGLTWDADEPRVRRLCQNTDVQIVKIAVDMDPVRNLCKGRAKIMVRYNPRRDSVEALVQNLEYQGLRVDM